MKRWVLSAALLLVGLLPGPALAHTNGAPILKCYDCHHAESRHRSSIAVAGLPAAYVPGQVYQLKVVIDSSVKSFGKVLGGFAVLVTGGELQVVDERSTQLGDNGILTHTVEGAEMRSWKFAWKAPQTAQEIDFRVMGTAANGDFSSFGDPVVAHLHTVAAKP